jgi:uncharacterized protein YqeY
MSDMPTGTIAATTTARAQAPVVLRERITSELTAAMKRRETVRVSTLRLIQAAVRDRDIAARAADCTTGCEESEILAILSKMVKQREEASQIYDDAGRPELALREREEIEVIREFLPPQIEGEELIAAVRAAVDEIGGTGLKDMGRAMDLLKSRYAGQINVQAAAAEVKKLLA